MIISLVQPDLHSAVLQDGALPSRVRSDEPGHVRHPAQRTRSCHHFKHAVSTHPLTPTVVSQRLAKRTGSEPQHEQLAAAAGSRQQAAGSRQQAADALNAHRLWATSHSESGVQCRRICASPRKIKSAHQLMQSAQADMLIWGFGRHAVGPGTVCTAVCPAVRVGERTGQSTGKLDARVTLHKYSGHGTL